MAFGNKNYYSQSSKMSGDKIAIIVTATMFSTFFGVLGGIMVDAEVGPVDDDGKVKEKFLASTGLVERYEESNALISAPPEIPDLTVDCEAIVSLYINDGELAETDINIAVEDMVDHPDHPCGISKTEVRRKYVALDSYEDDVVEYERAVEFVSENDYNELLKEEKLIEDYNDSLRVDIANDKDHKGATTGALYVGAIGFLTSTGLVIRHTASSRRRERRNA